MLLSLLLLGLHLHNHLLLALPLLLMLMINFLLRLLLLLIHQILLLLLPPELFRIAELRVLLLLGLHHTEVQTGIGAEVMRAETGGGGAGARPRTAAG